jgi:hypothetical protein
MTTKNDCLDFLCLNLAKTSTWRGLQAQRYPADLRNAHAAQILFDLAAQATDIGDDQWALLEPQYDPRDSHFYQAVSTASRDVGFRSMPRNFDDFVKVVLAALTVTA